MRKEQGMTSGDSYAEKECKESQKNVVTWGYFKKRKTKTNRKWKGGRLRKISTEIQQQFFRNSRHFTS